MGGLHDIVFLVLGVDRDVFGRTVCNSACEVKVNKLRVFDK